MVTRIQNTQQPIEGVTGYVDQLITSIVAATPNIIAALIILLIGWIVGRIVGGIVTRLADRAEIDKMVLSTPIGNILGGTERAVSRSFGKLAKWFIYALTILAAADVLAINLLSQWISEAVSYLPSLIGGILITVLGFILADFIADAVHRTKSATKTRYTGMISSAIRIFLYFIVTVIGLDTMGVDVTILNIFATALAWGLAAGIGLAIAIAFGWGGKDYVKNNINRWVDKTKHQE